MPEIEIRPAKQEDLEGLLAIDHDYTSHYAYQMEISQDAHAISVNFRNMKLPRAAAVKYPRNDDELVLSWEKATAIFVGWINGQIVSYLNLEEIKPTKAIRVRDLVVVNEKRRLGIASGMLLASEEWAAKRKNAMILMELQTRNYPAISLARKLGYQFCGYQDHYFSNKDMALFFSKFIR
jgi:ribosomal protein S18 acetylase RimI-like enzyme